MPASDIRAKGAGQGGATRYRWLLCYLLALFLLGPVLGERVAGLPLLTLGLSLGLSIVILAVGRERRSDRVLRLFALGALVGNLAAGALLPQLELARQLLMAFAFGASGAVIATDVFAVGRVNVERLLGAVCVYLLIGLCFAMLYMALDTARGDAFRMPGIEDAQRPGGFVYFSYVTLSTLGYGDVTPASALARALVSLEAVLGQLYLAIAIARLVGQHPTARAEPT